MIKKIVIAVLVLVVLALAAMKLIVTKKEIADAPTPAMLSYSIQTIVPHQATLKQTNTFLAQVLSDKEVNISTKLSGVIKKMLVSESQQVKKGELLLEIDAKSLYANLNTLKDQLRVQKNDLKYAQEVHNRNTKLYEAKAISKESFDASKVQLLSKEANYEATKDKITALKVDMTYLQVKAPFDGVVSVLFMHEGDLAAPSKPILSLNTPVQKMRISYASTSQDIEVGDEVLRNKEPIGFISKIYPNTKNNLNIAEVKLTKVQNLKNDSYISVDVVISTMSGCSVASNTLLHEKGHTFVLFYKDNKFAKNEVNVLIENGESAIIEPCIKNKVAQASESKLSILPFYKNIKLLGDNDE